MSKDRGDRFPSDANDTEPTNPVDNLSEIEFFPRLGKFEYPIQVKDSFDPELGAEQPPLDREDKVFIGLISERTSKVGDVPKYYDVILQNGDEVNGKVLFQPSDLDFEFMEAVVVIKGQEDEEYFIFGGCQPNETTLNFLQQNIGGNVAENAFQVTMGGAADFAIGAFGYATPDIVPFNTLDTDVVKGTIWTLQSDYGLLVKSTGLFKSHVNLTVYLNTPNANPATIAVWLQRLRAGTLADVPNSGQAHSMFGHAAGINSMAFSIEKTLPVLKDDVYYVVTAAVAGYPMTPYIDNTNTQIAPVWSVEPLDNSKIT